jgi:Ca2+-transporting ATPase
MATMTSPPDAGEAPAFHVLSVPEALEAEQVDRQRGLDEAEVERRREKYGRNRFAEAKK